MRKPQEHPKTHRKLRRGEWKPPSASPSYRCRLRGAKL